LVVRVGRPGESYVFNASEQAIELAGPPIVCRANGDTPIGNPVKDSMLAKVDAGTCRVLAIVYGCTKLPAGALEAATRELADLLGTHARAETVAYRLLPD
jgi:DNA/RNA-binding domain of Phe-tRNA-synthetase-like protein